MTKSMSGPARAVAILLIGLPLTMDTAAAAPVRDGSTGFLNMCGDGTTFTVDLPDREGGNDSITLPSGCRIYAFFVAGYGRNQGFNELHFYRFAKYVMENDGYVHWSWWNNLLKEYLGGPLHRSDATPGRGDITAFVPDDIISWAQKAVPDEDYQFQDDAVAVIRAIRERNPDAIVVVAGHSMGGGAVVRLGASSETPFIDLLAPIDPVGNRSSPVGYVNSPEFSWTRWRATHDFRGYRLMDCVRDPATGWCQDFRQNWWEWPQIRCTAAGDLLSNPPLFPATYSFPFCIGPAKYFRLQRIGANVGRLYHRWQKEFMYPFDFGADYLLGRDSAYPLDITSPKTSRNYQRAVEPALLNLPNDTTNVGKTCSFGVDPIDPSILCDSADGHGEIIGYRGPVIPPFGVFPVPWGTLAQNWSANSDERRALLVEMVTADDTWEHAPLRPKLCLVSEDLIEMLKAILIEKPPAPPGDTAPPITVATATPDANGAGWHRDAQVEVGLRSSDAGSGVARLDYALTGAQTGAWVVEPATPSPSVSASATLAAEGVTRLTYSARDAAGNAEPTRTLDVKIDRTVPQIEALITPTLVQGWSNVDVDVRFTATDALSGVATVTAPVRLTEEGPITPVAGSAADVAGNVASTQTQVGIDKTAPLVALEVPADGSAHLLNAGVMTAYACSDTLSGLRACDGPGPSGAPLDTGSIGLKQFAVSAADVAGNAVTHAHAYSVIYGFAGFLPPVVAPPAVNFAKAGSTVPIKWTLKDARGATVLNLGTVASYGSAPASCDWSVPVGPIEPAASAGGTALRIAEDGQYVVNWKTSKGWTGCRVFEVTLRDGSTHRLAFNFW